MFDYRKKLLQKKQELLNITYAKIEHQPQSKNPF